MFIAMLFTEDCIKKMCEATIECHQAIKSSEILTFTAKQVQWRSLQQMK